MVGKQYYTAVAIMSGKREIYAEQGAVVTAVVCRHPNVWIVEGIKGERFPVNPEKLSETTIAPLSPEVKERKKPESKKPLTQAEKIQLEYLNSIK